MADLPRTEPVVTETRKDVPMPEGSLKAPQVQVMQGNVDLVTIKLLEAINNNLILLKNAILEQKKNA